MRSATRRGVVASLGLTLLGVTLAAAPGTAAAESIPAPEASSPAAYVAYLTEKAAAGDTRAQEVANQFKELPAEKQNRFLELINDPAPTQALVEEADKAPEETTARSTLADGDVVIERVGETGEQPETASYRDMWASYTVYDTIFGIKVTKVSVRTNYQVKGKDTTKVYPGSATHYNYIPAASFSNSPVKEWISSPPGRQRPVRNHLEGHVDGRDRFLDGSRAGLG
ncbi:hypothetical protein ACH4VS_30425 [Streptomyces hygroscopicus]|uniref:hypothetical protein n=1 Tax=Streptomyces hygroscopicus TaxID=1912 RepID=UPI000A9534B9|nr:hypothetical protein [Streptomyces hygroscopicus]GLV77874.1 hypothetical protein Shyhy02_58740 [Streptomyces hygroscopicus subsp. hygroscopicus]